MVLRCRVLRHTSASACSVAVGCAPASPTSCPLPARGRRRSSAECRSCWSATATATLRGFLNVCRHRAAPLCDEPTGSGSLIRCPYHSWLYRLDGSLAKAQRRRRTRRLRRRRPLARAGRRRDVATAGVRQPRRPRRTRSISARSPRRSTPCPIEEMELVLSETNERRVQLEGAARELLGELPHAVRAPRDRHVGHRGLPDGQRRARAVRLGSAAPARRRRRRA